MKKLVIAMTFKGLRKFVPMNSSQQGRQQQITLFSSRVCDKPFWTWNIEDQVADLITNGDFCFNHIIALPKKCTKQTIFDYEEILFYTLQQYKHILVKKATGWASLNLCSAIWGSTAASRTSGMPAGQR
jgi:hypothetical protein